MNDLTIILRAASFAAYKHRTQRRKDALIQQSQGLSADDLVIRSLSIRARDLAGVLASALDDADHAPTDLRARLTGIREPAPDMNVSSLSGRGGPVKEAACG